MTRKEAQKRAAELSRTLREWQRAYFVESRPVASDAEYDRLFDELAAIEKQFPELALPDSPTSRVGSDLTQDLPEAAHTIPVLSLDKSYTAEELSAWIAKTARNAERELSFVCEEKIDGASMVLYYEKGVLARAVTRGNGLVGNDVTANVKTIGAVPLRLPRPVTLAARGEIFLARSLFDRINASLEEPYANPRNFASGALAPREEQRGGRHPAGHLRVRGVLPGAGGHAPRGPRGAGGARVPPEPARGFLLGRSARRRSANVTRGGRRGRWRTSWASSKRNGGNGKTSITRSTAWW